MKLYQSNRGRAQLRREQFNKSQTKSQFKGKKSMTKRIIEERVDGITADNIKDEYARLACMIDVDNLIATIMYHLKFGKDTRPSIFNEDVITGCWDRIKDLQVKFLAGVITAQEHVEILEEMDAEIMGKLDNYKQCK